MKTKYMISKQKREKRVKKVLAIASLPLKPLG